MSCILNSSFVNGFLIGALVSFLFSIWVLRNYYKNCMKIWIDEVIKQYKQQLEIKEVKQ